MLWVDLFYLVELSSCVLRLHFLLDFIFVWRPCEGLENSTIVLEELIVYFGILRLDGGHQMHILHVLLDGLADTEGLKLVR